MKLYKIKNIILLVGLLFVTLEARESVASDAPEAIRWSIPAKELPLPLTASKEVLEVLSNLMPPNIERAKRFTSKSKDEWRDWIEYSKASGEAGSKAFAKRYNVSIKQERMAGVNLYRVTPATISAENKNKIFIYLHGGAYVFGGGMSALTEAVLIAQRVQIPVIAIDYRMPPDNPYPAGLNDVVEVYKALSQKHSPSRIAMGGSSSGGGLVLAVVHKLKALKLELPAALFVGTPWADLGKHGDSLYVNEGIDRKIVTYDGFLPEAVKLYANGHDLKDPGLSPIYGDFTGFPPTMLVTGTRDLFLSLAVRVHRKMRASGVRADLNVYEGLSHVEYFVIPHSPESKEVYRELGIFLKHYFR